MFRKSLIAFFKTFHSELIKSNSEMIGRGLNKSLWYLIEEDGLFTFLTRVPRIMKGFFGGEVALILALALVAGILCWLVF